MGLGASSLRDGLNLEYHAEVTICKYKWLIINVNAFVF